MRVREHCQREKEIICPPRKGYPNVFIIDYLPEGESSFVCPCALSMGLRRHES